MDTYHAFFTQLDYYISGFSSSWISHFGHPITLIKKLSVARICVLKQELQNLSFHNTFKSLVI